MPPVKFIAEISSNHNRDMNRALQFIKEAAKVGCDGVKFQLFKIDELFAPEILAKSQQHRDRRQWELPLKFIPRLSAAAHDQGLSFSCTPFYLKAVEELEPYVDFYKIASYELLWQDLFEACAQTGKPLVFSTGMSRLDEIHSALNLLNELPAKDITILRCTSAYPTPVQEANLASITTLREAVSGKYPNLDINIGWSDHTVSAGVISRAVHKYDANFIEFHFDLEGQGEEFGAGHCWLPEDIKPVIEMIRAGFEADGAGKLEPNPSEIADRIWRTDPLDGLRPLIEMRKKF